MKKTHYSYPVDKTNNYIDETCFLLINLRAHGGNLAMDLYSPQCIAQE